MGTVTLLEGATDRAGDGGGVGGAMVSSGPDGNDPAGDSGTRLGRRVGSIVGGMVQIGPTRDDCCAEGTATVISLAEGDAPDAIGAAAG